MRAALGIRALVVLLVVLSGCASVSEFDGPRFGDGPMETHRETYQETHQETYQPTATDDGSGTPNVPACNGQRFTTAPADIEQVESFLPRGGVYPPAHSYPTPHTSIEFNGTGTITAPGKLYITGVDYTHRLDDDAYLEHDYTVGFSLCEDVRGYFQHLGSLSPAIEEHMEKVRCEEPTDNPDTDAGRKRFCEYRVNYTTSPGEPIGTKDGGVEFGLFDLRKDAGFANPDRYRGDYRGMQCPLDYGPDSVREQFLAKSVAENDHPCGRINHDVPGTLNGNWFYDGGLSEPADTEDWRRVLAFLNDSSYNSPGYATVSIGGSFMEPAMWHVPVTNEGTHNRSFTGVTPDGKTYCYTAAHRDGKILVEMLNETAIHVEHQSGECNGSYAFEEPYTYRR